MTRLACAIGLFELINHVAWYHDMTIALSLLYCVLSDLCSMMLFKSLRIYNEWLLDVLNLLWSSVAGGPAKVKLNA